MRFDFCVPYNLACPFLCHSCRSHEKEHEPLVSVEKFDECESDIMPFDCVVALYAAYSLYAECTIIISSS